MVKVGGVELYIAPVLIGLPESVAPDATLPVDVEATVPFVPISTLLVVPGVVWSMPTLPITFVPVGSAPLTVTDGAVSRVLKLSAATAPKDSANSDIDSSFFMFFNSSRYKLCGGTIGNDPSRSQFSE